MIPSVETLEKAVRATLHTYDDNRTWSRGILAVEYEEAGGYMGSSSDFKNIDQAEFAKRLWAELEKLNDSNHS